MTDYIYSGSFPVSPAVNDTLTMNGVKYIYTSKGTWEVTGGVAAEGTTILSTGEVVTKFLRANGDGTSSWQVPTDTDTTYSAGTGLNLSSTTFNVDVGTTASKIIQLDGSARLPAVDGSLLTNLPAGGGIGEFIRTSIAISSDDTALANESTTSNNSNIGILAGALNTNTTGQDNVAIGLNTLKYSNAHGNTGVGKAALNENTSGTYNTGVGFLSGLYNTSGSHNLGLGSYSLWGHATSKLTGSYNIGVGYQTGYALSTGQYNFLGGYQAGYSLTTGVDNVCLGKNAGRGGNFNDGVIIGADAGNGLSGGENVLIGSMAVQGSSNASRNVVIGEKSGFLITGGGSNTIIGRYSGAQITTGSSNICLGINAGSGQGNFSDKLYIGTSSTESLIEGDFSARTVTINGSLDAEGLTINGSAVGGGASSIDGLSDAIVTAGADSIGLGTDAVVNSSNYKFNIGVGYRALRYTTTGNNNVGIGNEPLASNTTGSYNIALGMSLRKNTTGSSNIGMGWGALYECTFAGDNTAIGRNALHKITTGGDNVAIGGATGYNITTGTRNIGIGNGVYGSSGNPFTGTHNIALGSWMTGESLTTGGYNILMGHGSGNLLTSGMDNVMIGKNVGLGKTTSYRCVLLGVDANKWGGSGSDIIAIGDSAGLNCTGQKSIFIGSNAGTNETGSSKLYIGHSSGGESLIQGDMAARTVTINGSLDAEGLTFREVTETVYNLSGLDIDPANGGKQYKTLGGTTNFTSSIDDGQSVRLRIVGGDTHVVNWPDPATASNNITAIKWVTSAGNAAPAATADDVFALEREGTILYIYYLGSAV